MTALQPTSKGILGILLILLSLLYGLAVRARLFLYGAGILPTVKVDGIQVISIGNLSVGGTGKTPVTIRVAKMIGEKCAVVSRGYGRRSNEPVQVVADGANILADYPSAADEALLCAMELKNVPVICAPRRTDGIRAAKERFGARTVILDDAFSHLAAHRDKNILLVDALDPFGGGHLLPAGKLREPLSSAKRAEAVIITRANHVPPGRLDDIRELIAPLLRTGTPVFPCDIAPDGILAPSGERLAAREFLRGKSVRLLSGIASPWQFEESVTELGAKVLSHDRFADHHPYTGGEIAQIASQVREGEPLITTQKDLVRIPKNARGAFHTLAISAKIREAEAFREFLTS
ncbi:MAG: tetraacyldisaccharide 4'-kinase [Nitrospinae bacterium]|nr:tetraacyldisaccharide 4'-kinase [Nitrospinota bacterium]